MTRTCRYPDCTSDASETYTDRAGNELALCRGHYFEAVWPAVHAVSKAENTNDEADHGLKSLFTQ